MNNKIDFRFLYFEYEKEDENAFRIFFMWNEGFE
jgi:hypothetical protein